ncbi:hypothetical protein GOZ83_22020 [Agrobacterium vitis]|uniref:hypothetical protein n=1 Tax=Rhizobium/Agrobacterium group TaxID=227290 RepID=UPI0012E7CD41|nr:MULTISPECIES: hypothetical protein [Rhizobium/Agrobacterium group]MCF1492063.1 hypothetical protein [Allorhizobium ampelinum]MVA47742.1 hypothetical protein [Agrobacterium vitis]
MAILRIGSNILITLVLGLLLARWTTTLPYEFPWLTAGIAAAMRVLGIDTVENADDTETLGLLVIIVACVFIAAVAVTLANLLLRRRRHSR